MANDNNNRHWITEDLIASAAGDGATARQKQLRLLYWILAHKPPEEEEPYRDPPPPPWL